MEGTHPIKAWRESEGLTQEGAAARFGVTKATVSRWEAGTRQPGPERLPRIATATGISKRVLRPDLAEQVREAAQ